MEKLDLFPQQVLNVAAQETKPVSWAVPFQGKRKKHHGADCTACDRHLKRLDKKGDPIPVPKPMVLRPTDPADKRVLLVVADNTSFSASITWLVRYIRQSGFGGMICIELAVKCGGGRIDEVKPNHVDACRPHVVFTHDIVKPTHILLCGTKATRSFLGETVMVQKNRMTWQMIEYEDGRRAACVCTVSAVDAARNYIFRKNLREEVHFLVNNDWENARRWRGVVNIVRTKKDAEKLKKWAYKGSYFAFDYETTGRLFRGIEAVCIAFARHTSRQTWAIAPEAMTDKAVVEVIEELLTSPFIGKVGQNVKYDCHVTRQFYGFTVAPVEGCTRLMFKTLNAEGDADLNAIGMTVGIGTPKGESITELKRVVAELRKQWEAKHGRKPNKKEFEPMSVAFGELPYDVLLRRCALDTYTTSVAYAKYKVDLDNHPFLGRTYKKIVSRANEAYQNVEANGFLVSPRNIKLAARFIRNAVREAEEKLKPYNFDPDKTASIRAFFEREGLVSPYVTGKQMLPSTAKRALKKMRSQSTAISYLLDYRANVKLLAGYIETLPYFICSDSRVHPNILLDGTRSGRLSMTDPAMQTVASHSDAAKMVQSIYIVPDGYTLIAIDYKTLEIFVAAMWSMDRNMLNTLESGVDFHTETAKRIAPIVWKMDPEEIEQKIKADQAESGESAERNISKKSIFSTIYGMGPNTLADDLSIPVPMAKDTIKGIFKSYPGLQEKMEWAQKYARQHGEIIIPWNHKPSRVRPLPYIGYRDFIQRGHAERGASNSPIQGWASDFCTLSTIELDQIFRRDYAHGVAQIPLTVHDSILIECKDEYVDEIIAVAVDVMTGWPSSPLKLKVDVKTGRTWGSMSKYEKAA